MSYWSDQFDNAVAFQVNHVFRAKHDFRKM